MCDEWVIIANTIRVLDINNENVQNNNDINGRPKPKWYLSKQYENEHSEYFQYISNFIPFFCCWVDDAIFSSTLRRSFLFCSNYSPTFFSLMFGIRSSLNNLIEESEIIKCSFFSSYKENFHSISLFCCFIFSAMDTYNYIHENQFKWISQQVFHHRWALPFQSIFTHSRISSICL